MRKPIGILILLTACFQVQALEVTGVVFADVNGNGVRDPGEAGLEGIRVSNGREIVTTDPRGRYSIRISDERAEVFVLKPRDYRLPHNEFGRPRFFHIHYPQGSPERRYPGIAPTGRLPDSVDFGLIPADEPDEIRVLAIADPQVTDETELEYFERMYAAELAGLEDIDFALVLGDIMHDNLELFEPFDRIMGRIGHRWVAVAGNHDLDLDAETDRGATDTFTARYGPPTWAFEYGPAHFLILDTTRLWLPPEGRYQYTGGLRAEHLEFFRNYLDGLPEESLVVAAMHIPLADSRSLESFRAADRRRFLQLLSRFQRSLSLAGHTHTNHHLFLDSAAGWPGDGFHHLYMVGTASGSWWGGELDADGLPDPIMRDGTPPGYAIVELSAEGYRLHYRAVGRDADEQIALFGPGTIMADTYPNAYLYANVFNGNQFSRVEYRVDSAEWQQMTRVAEPDPRVLERVLARSRMHGDPTGPRLSPPADSPHLWKARMTTDIEPGEYQITVRTVDMFGQVYRKTSRFQVVAR